MSEVPGNRISPAFTVHYCQTDNHETSHTTTWPSLLLPNDFLLCRDFITFIMSLSALVLLLLLVCVQANFYGIVVNYYPSGNNSTGASTVSTLS